MYRLPWVEMLRAHAAAKVEVDGPLDAFKQMRRVDVTDVGAREFVLGTSEEMLWYDGDLADALYVIDRYGSSEGHVVDFFEWDKKASPARLLSVTEVRTQQDSEPTTRTVAVAIYRAEMATAAAPTPPRP